MKEVLKKIRKYEIRIRKAVATQLHGDMNSVFKGSGLEFDDVRAYQYGDDIRTINWNVSAKGHGTFVNTYKEDKEQTVYFLVDVSASQDIGNEGAKKIDLGKEITSVLAFSAARVKSDIGMISFSDTKEKYIKPGKGEKHAYAIFNALYKLKPKSLQTDLAALFKYAQGIIKKKSIIIIISDFIDNDYLEPMKSLAAKHDLIAIHLHDDMESKIPKLGIIPMLDKESNKVIWRNSNASDFRNNQVNKFEKNKSMLEEVCKKNQINYIDINTGHDYISDLIELFRIRNKSIKGA